MSLEICLNVEHKLEKISIEPVQFFRHRPDNFPTIRLAQLAMLYHKGQNLFSQIIVAKTVTAVHLLFEITINDYWQTHYQFDKESPKKKSLSPTLNVMVVHPPLKKKFQPLKA
jgi:hypothetical protein